MVALSQPMLLAPVEHDCVLPVTRDEANLLLRHQHYLGPSNRAELRFGLFRDGALVAVQVWAKPTSRYLPSDGTWLELSRWCMSAESRKNDGSSMHARVVRFIREHRSEVTTLVSYSDPSVGHTGALYRACNWQWFPTWHRLKPPPSGNGSRNGVRQEVKDRWVYPLRDDERRDELLRVKT